MYGISAGVQNMNQVCLIHGGRFVYFGRDVCSYSHRYPHSIIYTKEGSNDGLVSVQSAQWGTYLGTLKDVNHLDLVGWTDGIAGGLGLPSLGLKGMKAAVQGSEIGFSPGRFYLGVGDLLAGVEEEQGYVKDGLWIGPEGRKANVESVAEGGTPIRRSSSDRARARMEEVLRRTPSTPSTPQEERDPEDPVTEPIEPTIDEHELEVVGESPTTQAEQKKIPQTNASPRTGT